MNPSPSSQRPRILLVLPRGEAVRNFVYSGTLAALEEASDVYLLSVVPAAELEPHLSSPAGERVVALDKYRESATVRRLRYLVHTAHYRWIWSEVAKNLWEWRDATRRGGLNGFRWRAWKALVRLLANRPSLEALGWLERRLSVALRPTRDFDALFERLRPDLVFNASHVHGPAADLPLKVAAARGIRTAAFVFSWDNLTSRSRIFPAYDSYLLWTEGMRSQLLEQYPRLAPHQAVVTGTPQFDFHFDPAYRLSRRELCGRIGIDPGRPFVLYTTGMDEHFPDEHRTVEALAQHLAGSRLDPPPQLVVRTYVKGTSPEMRALADSGLPSTVFPEVEWDPVWFTPHHDDLSTYTSLLAHCAAGVNAASTVSLELMIHDKPVINLGFDPPGSDIPHHFRWIRHLEFDHYRPVVESGAVLPAYSPEDLGRYIDLALRHPETGHDERRRFLASMFGEHLDGRAGIRVAEHLLRLVGARRDANGGAS